MPDSDLPISPTQVSPGLDDAQSLNDNQALVASKAGHSEDPGSQVAVPLTPLIQVVEPIPGIDLTPETADGTPVESPETTVDTPPTSPDGLPALSTDNPPSANFTANHSVVDVLESQGVLSSSIVEQLKLESVTTGRAADQLVLDQQLVDEEVFIKAKATLLNVPYVRPSEIGASPEALTLIPESVAKRYKIFPFSVDKVNRTLGVAMANPMDLTAIEFIEKKSGMRIVPYIGSQSEIDFAIRDRYSQNLSTEVVAALKDVSEPRKKVVDVSQLGQVIREAPVAKIVETVLSFAMKSRASDVHIEPQSNRTRVRYRIDGILHEKLVLPHEVHGSVVSRIKILADLKIDEKRIPQDGRFTFTAGSEEVDLRISTLPTVYGEKIVMRLLKKSVKVPTLQELGMRGRALKNVGEAIVKPHGIILITGPTGSGKTTTLYSVLSKISTPAVNVVTLEDPVEYEIEGVNQVQVNPQAGLTFASGLRSFLRQDPNIIMVGEVRDSETAELAIQASLTGHLVYSTLHTNSASGALPRLIDMRAEPFLLASSITLIIGQRVARQICEDSKEAYTPSAEMLQDIKQTLGPLFESFLVQKGITEDQVQLYRGLPSATCGDTGYHGRIGIFEVLPVTERIARMIVEHRSAAEIELAAIEEGMILMKQDGYLKALEGITTIEEVKRVAEI